MKSIAKTVWNRINPIGTLNVGIPLLALVVLFLAGCDAPEVEEPPIKEPVEVTPPPAAPETAPPVSEPAPPAPEPTLPVPKPVPPAVVPPVAPAVEPPAAPAVKPPVSVTDPPLQEMPVDVEFPDPEPTLTTTLSPTRGSTSFTTRGVSQTTPEVKEPSSKEFHTVDIFYGTNRKPIEGVGESSNGHYGGERHREGPMEYGKTTVSIPLHHQIGIVERPKWYKLEFSEDPKKHVTIMDLEKMDSDSFFSTVSSTAGDKPKNEALLFIHGFNVAFDDAIRRTGQIAYDLDFGGVTLTYSWPSQASLGAYTIDEANAEWSIPHLTQFLIDLQENTEIDKIHVIAHSMGTRVLSYALANAKDEGFDLDLHNVILAAPDIDGDVFKDQILPKLTDATDKLTMYASSDDTALKLSQSIHGNSRLGLSGASLLVMGGMDTVNASGIDTSMLGHGYYGSHKVVVTDIFNLIIKGLDPVKRELIPGSHGEWDFRNILK
ncbi:MAG: alpha/beta hydrolase [Verrucomicrobiales bacterium]|nr:alpha/beta hydrolase [Verrucomicrobiales bacterium]